ncbi:hypothetical protein DdX_08644 [Ditylenchus destructor]|uniref:Uncharacterized protein n=1 Tax=Ditylenchus destructor TaxID=166010 RepID=A0AAD4R430_9BILA|nr:hypothetical protein DdX_08644 [Ditylenchus destructor]
MAAPPSKDIVVYIFTSDRGRRLQILSKIRETFIRGGVKEEYQTEHGGAKKVPFKGPTNQALLVGLKIQRDAIDRMQQIGSSYVVKFHGQANFEELLIQSLSEENAVKILRPYFNCNGPTPWQQYLGYDVNVIRGGMLTTAGVEQVDSLIVPIYLENTHENREEQPLGILQNFAYICGNINFENSNFFGN